jgi:hypothetical protein
MSAQSLATVKVRPAAVARLSPGRGFGAQRPIQGSRRRGRHRGAGEHPHCWLPGPPAPSFPACRVGRESAVIGRGRSSPRRNCRQPGHSAFANGMHLALLIAAGIVIAAAFAVAALLGGHDRPEEDTAVPAAGVPSARSAVRQERGRDGLSHSAMVSPTVAGSTCRWAGSARPRLASSASHGRAMRRSTASC